MSFRNAFNNLRDSAGGKIGGRNRSRHEEFGTDDLRNGYERSMAQFINMNKMIDHLNCTGNMGMELLACSEITNFGSRNQEVIVDENLRE